MWTCHLLKLKFDVIQRMNQVIIIKDTVVGMTKDELIITWVESHNQELKTLLRPWVMVPLM